jgi:peptidoglycan/LPS O-acetylase OafA/YrhL
LNIELKSSFAPAQGPLRHHGDIPSLTGLRFLAAFSVAIAHGADVTFRISNPSDLFSSVKFWLTTAAGIGMPLFFVLSGFVIHYNYRTLISKKGAAGFFEFLWARFSRLYPLFVVFIMFDFLLSSQVNDSMAYDRQDIVSGLRALPYILTFTQSWTYSIVHDHSLIFRLSSAIPLTWSISTEWFFYLCYPAIMLLIIRVNRPVHVIGLAVAWTLIWATFASELYEHAGGLNSWAGAYFGIAASTAYNHEESFVQWVLYFSPYVRIGEFVLGCIVAQLYLALEGRRQSRAERIIALIAVVVAVASVPVLMYMMYAPDTHFWVRHLNSNYGLAPSLGVILFCAARYDFGGLRWLSTRPIIRLGEASYSIYLTHMTVFLVVCGSQGPLPGGSESSIYLYARLFAMLAVICLVSLALFASIEAPARRALRTLWRKPGFPLMPAIVNAGAVAAAAVLVLQNLLIIAHARRSVASSGIQIESATFGGSCGTAEGNVTLRVQAACQGRSECEYVVNDWKLGDPAPGCKKSFAVSFTCAPGHESFHVDIPGGTGIESLVRLNCNKSKDNGGAAGLRTPTSK